MSASRPCFLSAWLICFTFLFVSAGGMASPWLRPARVMQSGASPYGSTIGVVDIYQPRTIVVQFPSVSGTGTTYDSNTHGTTTTTTDEVWFRSTTAPTGTAEQLYNRGGPVPAPPVVTEPFDLPFGTRYYYMAVSRTQSVTTYPNNQPPPQQSIPLYTIQATFSAVPVQATVTDNQSVDARYDPRYSAWTFVNHRFGATTYRGGLYAGYNADGAQVGHAYLKFQLPPLPAGQHVWVGSVNAFYTRSYATGSTVIACQSVSPAWDPAALVWSNAPALTPANAAAAPQFTVSYDSVNPPSPSWAHWTMPDITTALVNSGAYAVGLGGFSEPSTATNPIGGSGATGWAYFAKKEYAQGQPACVLYAYGPTQ